MLKAKPTLFIVLLFCLVLNGCASLSNDERSASLEEKVADMEQEPVTRLSFVSEVQGQGVEQNIQIVLNTQSDISDIVPASGDE
tara:strand:- start:720 stop:971 length:252 start_codon:yes stop_codon:yes gene_type:complete